MALIARLTATAAVLALIAGCPRKGPPPRFDPDAPVVVIVRNNNFQDVDVFAFGDGGQRRLGTVVAHTSGTFSLTPSFIGRGNDLRLVAEPVANRSGGVQARVGVLPGQQITWMLESSLTRSYVSVR
ncbi:MAG TPA: hypothetical protein VNA89_04490 [Gemmatimonadaceae bacterium]|nr:hypothetical protein [Gemmatimonadaceae bacterium]